MATGQKDIVVDAFEEAFEEYQKRVQEAFRRIGSETVADAKSNGTYQDRTGNLRESNGFIVYQDGEVIFSDATEQAEQRFREEDMNSTGVVIGNSAFYGGFVEAKGFSVISSELLEAEKKIGEL